MINSEVFTEPSEIDVKEENTVLCLESDDNRNICLNLPPAKKLRNIASLMDSVSLRDFMTAGENATQKIVSYELNALEEKHERFKGSKTYLNHLASFHKMAGDFEHEKVYLDQIPAQGKDDYFFHRKVSNLILSGNKNEARDLVLSDSVDNSGNNNLSLAYLSIQEGDYESAEKYSIQALKLNQLNFRARTVFGSLKLIKGEFDEAIRQYKITSEDQPYSSSLFLNLALAYLCKDDIKKAKKYVKRSVSLNPLNRDAVILFADLIIDVNKTERNHDRKKFKYNEAIRILENFIQYESDDPVALERLAQAYFLNNDYNEALNYLKKQNIIDENPHVLNNIALIYRRTGNKQRAYQYFKRALIVDPIDKHFEIMLNFVNFLLFEGKYKEVVEQTSQYLDSNLMNMLSRNDVLAKVYFGQVLAKIELRDKDFDLVLIENLSTASELSEKVKLEFIVFLMFLYATYLPEKTKTMNYAAFIENLLSSEKDIASKTKDILINNLVYAFVEFDEVSKAERYMGRIGSNIHKDVFQTATAGLYYIKKGNLKKGENLYRESIRLTDKLRIKGLLRQKMYLEIGKSLLKKGENYKAANALKKASGYMDGYDHFRKEAAHYLKKNGITQKHLTDLVVV